VGYGLAFTPANRTGRSYRKKTLVSGNLPHTTALPAGLRACPRFASIPIACGASFPFFNFDLGFCPEGGFHKAEGEIIAQVGSPLCSGSGTSPAPEAQKILEYIS
jgi:hypothetical protein